MATYDIRMRKPNVLPFLENAVLHTIEHFFAALAEYGKISENGICFGSVGLLHRMY